MGLCGLVEGDCRSVIVWEILATVNQLSHGLPSRCGPLDIEADTDVPSAVAALSPLSRAGTSRWAFIAEPPPNAAIDRMRAIGGCCGPLLADPVSNDGMITLPFLAGVKAPEKAVDADTCSL